MLHIKTYIIIIEDVLFVGKIMQKGFVFYLLFFLLKKLIIRFDKSFSCLSCLTSNYWLEIVEEYH